ncbi:MAG: zinc-dependent peptidase [Candidatus Accumulibacter sp.]|jgi:Mlc titration factor MtfA (ptsG expression regulator)|nr:zinc-dependent peptidase [Accumulibacter sp.]
MFLAGLLRRLRGFSTPARIPDALWRATLGALPFLARLSADEAERLKRLSERFLAEKEFTGAGGLEITDAICVSVAAQACLPILNLGIAYYDGWVGIVVYPDEFVVPRITVDETGVAHEYDDVASGEAWEGGPVVVSWGDAKMAGDGYNVVIHEFAHKLDMRDGRIDGVPPLPPDIPAGEWEDALHAAFDEFQTFAVVAFESDESEESDDPGEPDGFDDYAATNPEEFFAVMSEAFFEAPKLLRGEFPALYALFARFYRQDPARAADVATLKG